MEPAEIAAAPRAKSGRARIIRADVWTVGAVIVAFIVAMPLISVIGLALTPESEVWGHLIDTVFWGYVGNTLALGAGVSVGTLAIGLPTAWLVTMCRFPGRRLFEWALLVPLAVPAYVIAYTYTDILEYAGPVQGALREVFNWTSAADYYFPEIRSLFGATLMFSLVLYPYIYLLARAAFLAQSVAVLEVSRTLGRTAWGAFWSVALPMARPALVVGLALVLMETLNDFGTVEYFAVPTLTLGIFNVWLGMDSVEGAAQLASILLIFVMVLIGFERAQRSGRGFQETRAQFKPLVGYELRGWRKLAAMILCGAPICLGFLVPASVLSGYALTFYGVTLEQNVIEYAANSVMLSGGAALAAVVIAVFMAYALRLRDSPAIRLMAWIASMGYGVPGAVLAVGAVIPLTWFDNTVDGFMRSTFGISTGLLITGTMMAVMVGYVVRFLALSFGTVEAGLGKITRSMDDAARSLGHRPLGVLRKIHLPMLRTSLLAATLLVFVDSMKELPMTLLLRPFNFETLATFVYQFASDELLEECALAALAIVAVGIGPVIVLSAAIRGSRPGEQR